MIFKDSDVKYVNAFKMASLVLLIPRFSAMAKWKKQMSRQTNELQAFIYFQLKDNCSDSSYSFTERV